MKPEELRPIIERGKELRKEIGRYNMTLSDLVGRLTHLEHELQKEETGEWQPKDGDFYYVIEPNGAIAPGPIHIPVYLQRCLELGNAFRTREEAEKEVKHRKDMVRIKKALNARFGVEASELFRADEEWG